MSANPLPAQNPAIPAAPERAVDPSMEDILASIRKIIADEQEASQTAHAPAAAAPAARPEADFEAWLQQTASGEPGQQPVQSFAAPSPVIPEPPLATGFAPPAPAPAPHLSVVARQPQAEAAPRIPAASIQAVSPRDPLDAPLQAAPHQELHPQKEPYHPAAAVSGEPLVSQSAGASVQSSFQALARTMFMQNSAMVDEAVRDMLRPMLKQWLDDNLPVIVEKLVRAEIERVARGGR